MSLVQYKEALKLLKKGEIVAIPTETVYGLAGRIDFDQTIKKIFEIKKRPFSDPLIVHFYNKDHLKNYVQEDISFLDDLWSAFAPGPLTIVLKKTDRISPLITNSKDFVAVRIPRHPIIRRLLKDIGVPLAAPSANFFSHVSPTRASHVISGFSGSVPVLDGGECEVGLESTLIKFNQERKKLIILRPGSITQKDFEKFFKERNMLDFSCEVQDHSSFPGGSKKHYAPNSPVVIVESEKSRQDVYSFLMQKFPDKKIKTFLFKSSSKETAFNLYEQLRNLSEKGGIICVQKRKEQCVSDWVAVWNRLEKASSFYFKL